MEIIHSEVAVRRLPPAFYRPHSLHVRLHTPYIAYFIHTPRYLFHHPFFITTFYEWFSLLCWSVLVPFKTIRPD